MNKAILPGIAMPMATHKRMVLFIGGLLLYPFRGRQLTHAR